MGYPNVGKSSTINTIMGNKKVSVSATPGHTKHFQVFISTASASVFPSQPVPRSGHFLKFFVIHVLLFSPFFCCMPSIDLLLFFRLSLWNLASAYVTALAW